MRTIVVMRLPGYDTFSSHDVNVDGVDVDGVFLGGMGQRGKGGRSRRPFRLLRLPHLRPTYRKRLARGDSREGTGPFRTYHVA